MVRTAIVVCQSEEEERILLQKWEDEGYHWADGKLPTYYHYYKHYNRGCYYLSKWGDITRSGRTEPPEAENASFIGYFRDYINEQSIEVDVTDYL